MHVSYGVKILFFRSVEEINPLLYNISLSSKDSIDFEGIITSQNKKGTVSELIHQLEKFYCGPLAAEFDHLPVS